MANITFETTYFLKFLHNSKMISSPDMMPNDPSSLRMISPYSIGVNPISRAVSMVLMAFTEISSTSLKKTLEGCIDSIGFIDIKGNCLILFFKYFIVYLI